MLNLSLLSCSLYLLTGAIAGLLAGMFGIGGGIIVVPALVLVLTYLHIAPDLVMHLAEGSPLAAMIFTTLAATTLHARRTNVMWPIVLRLLPGIVIATFLGALLAAALSGEILSNLFAIFLFYLSARFFLKKVDKVPLHSSSQLKLWPLYFFGVFLGFTAGLLGIGGGVFIIPVLLYCGFTLAQATGTSAACANLVAIVGTLAFTYAGWNQTNLPPGAIGYVYWPAALITALASIVLVPFGVKLAIRLRREVLRRIFAIILAITAVELIYFN